MKTWRSPHHSQPRDFALPTLTPDAAPEEPDLPAFRVPPLADFVPLAASCSYVYPDTLGICYTNEAGSLQKVQLHDVVICFCSLHFLTMNMYML